MRNRRYRRYISYYTYPSYCDERYGNFDQSKGYFHQFDMTFMLKNGAFAYMTAYVSKLFPTFAR